MSARLLRKVLKEKEESERKLQKEIERAEEFESPESKSNNRNPFDLLEDSDENELEVDNEIGEFMEQESSIAKNSSNLIQSNNRKASKTKKRNKKDGSSKSEADKQFDLILERLSIDTGISDHNVGVEKTKVVNTNNEINSRKSLVLSVDPKLLRAENELKRIFGSKVVNSFENNHNIAHSKHKHGRRRGSSNLRKTILVSPSIHWPLWDGSLSMEILETKDGKHFFRYVHSSSYIRAQQAFEAAKAIHDLNGIAGILAYHPYHLESLLTIADVLKFSGEHQASSDAIGKCLFALECAWHPLFSPQLGNCQLKYIHETNKTMFVALFNHMRNMDRRGCHRSALEVCKLILSLDSDDPMGVIFCIDYFSLRAEEYEWLEYFVEEYKNDNSLWLFPNFSYSLAICRFYLEQKISASKQVIQSKKATANELMKQALMLHPSVLKQLVVRAPMKDRAWTKILEHSFFRSAKAGSPTLDHLINVYIERNYIIWRFPDLQNLLRDAAEQVIECLNLNSGEVKNWECVRKEAFSSEKNEYAHLSVSDFSDSVPTLPPEDLQYLMVGPHVQNAAAIGEHVHNPVQLQAPREVQNRNPAIVFLESLLPWVNYGSAAGGQHGVNPENEN